MPAEVREAGDALIAARCRYREMRDEVAESDQAIREAQDADQSAVREAVAAGKPMPKPKAQAIIERTAQLERGLGAARSLAIEAEDRYLNAWRSHRADWLEAFNGERERLVAETRAAQDALREAILTLHNADAAHAEMTQLGDPSKIKDAGKSNAVAMLCFRRVTRLDREAEQKLAELVA